MILTNILVGISQEEQGQLISVSFTALVLNELIMIALEIHTWHKYMIWAEILTFAFYFLSIPFLKDYFGKKNPSRDTLIGRFILYHHLGVCLEDYCNFTG